MVGSWTETVEPIKNESALQQRAWVEDNRRTVDELSGRKLAYVWVPNTGGGYTSFNRYLFAQQDKLGAVIDERFNGGGTSITTWWTISTGPFARRLPTRCRVGCLSGFPPAYSARRYC